MKNKGFTLVELIIVVTILGIMAAIVIPTFQGHAATARESAAKSNLATIRTQIELYSLQHNGVPPGYANGVGVNASTLETQFVGTTTVNGISSPSTVPADPFLYGPYLKSIPKNPFNDFSDIAYSVDFAVDVGVASIGWLYNKDTGEIALNWAGTDKKGVNYYDY